MKKYKNYIIIIIFILFIMILMNSFGIMLGSDTDWLNQHTIIPDYFRNLFYETKQLFPNFALNYGGGQNIFNLAYYGLFNPIILISYLLPFIKMIDYIIISNIVLMVVSGILMYKWLNNKYNDSLSLLGTFIFITSAPLIFHTHRHIMFINYIPFLILGLISIDNYYKKNRGFLLIISVFLIIMTSFYYSIPSLIILFVYNLYCYFKSNKTGFIKEQLKIILLFLIGILLSSFLLLPIIYTIFNGRSSTNTFDFSLLIPDFNLISLLYDAYGVGLSSILLFSLLNSFKDRRLKLISIILSILVFIPLFRFVLNGGLYSRAKVFIPFIPLFIILILEFIKKIFDKKITIKELIIYSLIIIVLSLISGYINILLYLDLIVLILFIYLYLKYQKDYLIYIPIYTISLLILICCNLSEDFVSKNEYNNIFCKDEELEIKEILDSDNTLYRFNNLKNSSYNVNKIYDINYNQTSIYSSTYNEDYYNFYYNVFKNANSYYNYFLMANTPNILFSRFMGVKYVYSLDTLVNGYNYLGNDIYEVNNTMPIIYANNNIISNEEFNELGYPYNVDSLMHNVVGNNSNINYISNIKEIKLDYSIKNNDNVNIEKKDNGYMINVLEKSEIYLDLNSDLENKILFISFKLNSEQSCDIGDLEITINNVKNNKSCEEWIYYNQNEEFNYVISDDLKSLKIVFGKGVYDISDISVYEMDFDSLNNEIIPVLINEELTKGDKIVGNINLENSSYIVTSIPYDKGFTVKVNNEEIDYEKVNTAFLGFYLNEGYYDIEISYEAPLFKEGKIMSLITLLGLCLYGFVKKENK